ncbi:MAG: hypothetical protein NT001_04505 [Candidatus Woesearchaeota archaeon]|nr:hypothetical protein [Candidatus Woesearchaeota archaeon]
MKHRMSITLDEETILALFEKMRQSRGDLRSKSHAVEMAIKSFVEAK